MRGAWLVTTSEGDEIVVDAYAWSAQETVVQLEA